MSKRIPFPLPKILLAVALVVCAPLAYAQADDGPTHPLVEAPPAAELPTGVATLLQNALGKLLIGDNADPAEEERELRRAETAAREVLATEGYFSPHLSFEPADGADARYRLHLQLNDRATVDNLDLKFVGAVNDPAFEARLRTLRDKWPLIKGAAFRSADWERAKSDLLAQLQSRDFAGARLLDSNAKVDVETASVQLSVQIDSGPAYTVGPLEVVGLTRYQPSLLERYNTFKPGQPYDRAQLVQFQQALQEAPYFSSVLVAPQLDPQHPLLTPLRVDVTEAKTKRVGVGVGYATDTGAHLETSYRQALLFGAPYTLQGGLRIDQKGGYAYSDLLLPPKPDAVRDALGALYEDNENEGLHVKRWGLGASRTQLRGPRDANNIETTLSVNFEHELRATQTAPEIEIKTLSTTYDWTRRSVDSLIDPHRGNVLSLEGNIGTRGLQANDIFTRGYGRLTQYFPIGERDVLIVRGELGVVFAQSSDAVPNKFLFRTGGSTSVRGYDYQSLGVLVDGATVGGRALAVGSIEYVKWLSRWDGKWGVATFVDGGDAKDSFRALDPAYGAGVGVRWKTPAGPLAVDVAYGERSKQVRLHFAVAVAF